MLDELRRLLPVIQGDPEQIESDMGRANAHCQQQAALRQLGNMLPGIIDSLARQDIRVIELIRYNSTEVVKRRKLTARLRAAAGALQKAGATFRDYARQHRAKDTPDGTVKAMKNDQMADTCQTALAFDPDPADFGPIYLNHIVVIGDVGYRTAYLNMDRESAIALWMSQEEEQERPEDRIVDEFDFDNRLLAYDVYPSKD